jgi:nucleoside permease NupC
MGIALATLGVFAPSRKRTLVQIAPRALIGGNMVSLMTASIAGIDIKWTQFFWFLQAFSF